MTDEIHSPYFRNEDGFWEDFGQFNSFFGVHRWQATDARKDHEDEFGHRIPAGETYFSRSMGAAWNDQAKLSRRSMEILLRCLLWSNDRGKTVGEELKKDDQDRLGQATEKAWPQLTQALERISQEPTPPLPSLKPTTQRKKP